MAGDRFAVLNTSTGNLDIKADGATIAISTLNLSVALALTYGGTNASLTANTGGIVYSSSSALAILSGTATANKVLMSGATAAPTWSLVTYPNAATPAAGKIIVADGTNWVASTPTYPNAATPTAGKLIIADGTNWVASTPTHPTTATAGKIIIGDGTNWVLSTPTYPTASPAAGKVMIGDGTNWLASTPTYPNAAPAAGKILRGDATNFVTSTFTIVDTMAINTLLYANSANTIQALPTANSSVLVTDGSGVPSLSTAIPTTVTMGAVRTAVAQGSHGFTAGQVLKFAGGVYALAQADTAADAEVVGMVVASVDAGNFTMATNGYISGLTGFTANTLYYLSGSTPGALTSTAPTTEGYINKPVFFATSTTAGYFINYRGVSVTTSTSYYQSFVNGDLSAGVLTVNHNLGHKYCTVQVFDNSDINILPDTITLTSTTALTIDLTSYGTLTGTWHVVVLDIGSQLSTPVAVTSGGTGLATIAAGAIPYASALNTIAALGIGAANKHMFVNAGATAPEWASAYKIGSFTKNMADGDSTQSFAGVGFKPSCILLMAGGGANPYGSIGVDDTSSRGYIADRYAINPGDWAVNSDLAIAINVSNSDRFWGTVSAFGSDGFSITWTHLGSPTGTITVVYLAFR